MDERRARRLRAPRGRGEGHQAGADAHQQRGLAEAGQGRPPHPLAAHAGRAATADRRRRTHLLLRPRATTGTDRGSSCRCGSPKSDRRARHVVRTRLAWAGFGSLGPGLWISPHAAREREAVRVLTEAGVAGDAHVFVGPPDGPVRHRAMVAAAWDLPAVERGVRPVPRRVPRPGAAGDVLAQAARAGARLAPVPLARPVAAPRAAARQWSGTAAARAVRRPARAVGGRLAPRVEAPEQPVANVLRTLTQSARVFVDVIGAKDMCARRLPH